MENSLDENKSNISQPGVVPKATEVNTPKMPIANNNLKKFLSFKAIFIFIILILIALVGLYYLLKLQRGQYSPRPKSSQKIELEKFKTEADFRNYLASSEVSLYGGLESTGFGVGAPVALEKDSSQQALEEAAPGGGVPTERVSETTVQVAGIDEPDIVKSDGTNIFLSSTFSSFYPLQDIIFEESVDIDRPGIFPAVPLAETKILSAFPPETLAKSGVIDKNGDLLLIENNLIIFSGNTIYGFDVNDTLNPQEIWKMELEEQNQVVSSRLYKGVIYLVTRTNTNKITPCPMPLTLGSNSIFIPCIDIYHPRYPMSVDSTFTVLTIDPKNGEIKNKVSFVGSANLSVIYMSPNAIYITYTQFTDITKIFYDFFNEKGKDLLPGEILGKLKKLNDYDISLSAKFTELQVILESYYSSLNSDERLRIENEVSNRLSDFTKEKARELEKTGIVKVAVGDLTIKATGEVPGRPLNQFSLDEYQENLRVATTTSGGLFGGRESVNDVYILDSDMTRLAGVTDLGKGERIYAVRFIEDKGYVVTFREIDPFYVLDLANPKQPQLKGELKIPGYSSYLHPITKDKILGVGQEESQVKISLFDVTNPANPTEVAKYLLDEYWSEVSSTHHAFLLDDRHQVFFIPGGKGGYIFSYKGNVINLIRAISETNVRRAIYINDYMYIIGDTKINILNEADWQEVNQLSF